MKNAIPVLIAVVSIGLFMDRGATFTALQAAGAGSTVNAEDGGNDRRPEKRGPLPVTITNTPLPVAVDNFPGTQNVNVTNPSIPVSLQRTPVHDGQFFDITQPSAPPFQSPITLSVPAGVVLTDAHATFSVPENVPNAASLFISDDADGKVLVYQIINNTTFSAGVDLESGIVSAQGLTIQLSCYNIAANHCQGALMWSGYTTP
jgi:hypothetical protein